MNGSLALTIAGGAWVNGVWCREVELRALTGADELELMDNSAEAPSAEWTTEVLTRCLIRFGGGEPVTREAVRSLIAGDREALLLHLRRLRSGDRMPCVVRCPSPACGHALEFDLSVADLLLPGGKMTATRHEMTVGEAGIQRIVRFRLPNGADQEAVASAARTDPARAAELLWQRCVESLGPGDAPGAPGLIEAVSARMAELDAQAELRLEIACPACGGSFATIFDTAGYLFQELRVATHHLYREVHLLAYHYHWSPSDILAMSPRQRQRYLRLLEEELTEGAVG